MAFHKQNSYASHFLTTFVLLTVLLYIRPVLSDASIGINYGRIADNLPSPPQVIQLLQQEGCTKVKIYDAEATVLSALSGSKISVTVALPNDQLSSAAASQSFTDNWVQSNILPYQTNIIFDAIAVGNEVFSDPQNTQYLVPAMTNMQASLSKYSLPSSIKVSSPIALSALQTSYPSSSGSFKPEHAESVMKPMLSFLKQTGSYLMVNVYPFLSYVADPEKIPLDYALLRDNAGNKDPNNGKEYKSLFVAQVDAFYAAMSALEFPDVAAVVTETGWPSKGDQNEVGATVDNAATYNRNLVQRVLTGDGTPLRPNQPLNVYLFALFNENQKPGATSEKNYGLFYPNGQKVYDIQLHK